MVYSNTAVYMGELQYRKTGQFSIITYLKHLLMIVNCKIFRA